MTAGVVVCTRCRRTMFVEMTATEANGHVCARGSAKACQLIVLDRAAHPGYYKSLKSCAAEAVKADKPANTNTGTDDATG